MCAIFSWVSGGQKERDEKGTVAMEGEGRSVNGGKFPGVRGGKSASKEGESRKKMVCRISG